MINRMKLMLGILMLIVLSGCGSEMYKQYGQQDGWYLDGVWSDIYLGNIENVRLYLANKGYPECENEIVTKTISYPAYDPITDKTYTRISKVNVSEDKLCKKWYGCPHCYSFRGNDIIYAVSGAGIALSFHQVENGKSSD